MVELLMSNIINDMSTETNIYKYDGRYESYTYLENWLMEIKESEWLYLKMLSETPDRRPLSEDEICYLAEIALPMYCQEMQLDEVPYDADFLHNLVGYLLTGVVVLGLKLKGVVKTDEPVKLYDSYSIETTDKMCEVLENYQQTSTSDLPL